jgi:hypothetical protein
MRNCVVVMIAILSVGAAPAWPQEAGLRLEVETALRTLRVGQETTLKLRIVGTEIARLLPPSEGVVTDTATPGAFVYEFKFRPPREGPFTFGPYQLSFNGRSLTSNAVSMRVLPPWNGTYGTFFRVDSNSITLGESIELVAESWSEKPDVRAAVLKGNSDAFTLSSPSVQSLLTMNNGVSASWRQCRWLLTPKKAGAFRITQDSFQSLPPDVTAPDLAITVREPSQIRP